MIVARTQNHFASIALAGLLVLVAVFAVFSNKVAEAACAPFSSEYGILTASQSIDNDGTYALWARVKAPDASSPLKINVPETSDCNITLDSSSVNESTWMWINTNPSGTPIRLSLNSGNVTIQATAGENYKLDAILLLDDLNCTPQGNGSNCASTVITPETPVNNPVHPSVDTSSTGSSSSGSKKSTGSSQSQTQEDTVEQDEANAPDETETTDAPRSSSSTPSSSSDSSLEKGTSDTESTSKVGRYIAIAVSAIAILSIGTAIFVLKLKHSRPKPIDYPPDDTGAGPGNIITPTT